MSKKPLRKRSRLGFTLVELLVVLVIISIIASLAAAAFINSMRTARIQGTEAMLRLVSDALSDRLESYYASARGATFNADATSTNLATVSGSSNNSTRAKVLARIEGLRAAFPQELREFLTIIPSDSNAPESGGYCYIAKGPIQGYRNAVLEIVAEAANEGTDTTAQEYKELLLENESSECLYLILSQNSREAMSFTIDDIPSRFIKDTDGDGLMEILDAWGNPVQFYRWPTDLYAYLIEVEQSLPRQLMAVSNIDPDGYLLEDAWYNITDDSVPGRAQFENVEADLTTSPLVRFFRVHAAYADVTNPSSDPPADPTDAGNKRSYPILPVVISAGPDGEFGLHLTSTGSTTEPTDLSVRCGRVDATDDTTLAAFADNLLSLKQRAGATQ